MMNTLFHYSKVRSNHEKKHAAANAQRISERPHMAEQERFSRSRFLIR